MEINIGIIRRWRQSFLRERLTVLQLKPVDGVTLLSISRCECCNQEMLCNNLDLDKGRVARAMGRLEARGLIRRAVNPLNRREKRLELTEEGLQVLEVLCSIEEAWQRRCFAGFTEQEIKECQSYLERIAKNALAEREADRHE